MPLQTLRRRVVPASPPCDSLNFASRTLSRRFEIHARSTGCLDQNAHRASLTALHQPDCLHLELQRVNASRLSVFTFSHFVSLQLLNSVISYGVRFSGATSNKNALPIRVGRMCLVVQEHSKTNSHLTLVAPSEEGAENTSRRFFVKKLASSQHQSQSHHLCVAEQTCRVHALV
jgi:hypothetical protein